MKNYGTREQRALKVMDSCRIMVGYSSNLFEDKVLYQQIRMIIRERRRFAYRRLLFLLRRAGYAVNYKQLGRLYHEEELLVRHQNDSVSVLRMR